MANLVTLALQYLGGDTIAKLASSFGIDNMIAEKAVNAAVPALLGALTSVASKPGGAAKVLDAIKGVDPSVLAGLGKMLGSPKQDALVSAGGSVLSSLLGGSSSSALVGALAKFAGVNNTAATSLLGLLTPVVLGTIKNNAPGLDAAKLTSLLGGQKSYIQDALPAGLASALGGSGLLDAVTGAASQATAAASRAADNVVKAAPPAPKSNWMTWLIPLLALAALAWYFLGNQRTAEAPAPAPATTTTAPATPAAPTAIMVDGVDVTKTIGSTMDALKSALGGITDAATATAALPKLTEGVTQIDTLTGLVGKLSAEQKTIVAGLIAAAMPTINEVADKVLAIPGVGDIAKPTIDSIRAKLDALSKA
jgi:hypothetical protein